MSNVSVLGAGRIGQYIIQDCLKWAGRARAIDQSKDALKSIPDAWNVNTLQATLSELEDYLEEDDLVISCLPFRCNLRLTEQCIRSQTSMVDLGGATDVVLDQLSMDEEAKEAGVTIIPDCGLSPGITNILAGELVRKGMTDAIRIRVGGVPRRPSGEWKYEQVFSIEGLVQEYIAPVYVLEEGEIKTRDPLTDLETFPVRDYSRMCHVDFEAPEPMEAFLTSGGSSTLPHTYSGTVGDLTDKSIRYRGHREKIQKMIAQHGTENLPEVLEEELDEGREDLVIMLVEGRQGDQQFGYFVLQEAGSEWTAMSIMTGSGAATVAQMIAEDQISANGVRKQERHVEGVKFMELLASRGIAIHTFESHS